MGSENTEGCVSSTSGPPCFGHETTQHLVEVHLGHHGGGGVDEATEPLHPHRFGHTESTITGCIVTEMDKLRIVLIDDHEVVRTGIKAMIDSQDDMEVVGEAGSVEEGIRRVGYDEPDVVVLDVRLPDGSGVEACRDIRQRFPDVNVLMLTSFADEEALMSAILAGAAGYVLKRVKGTDLIESIRRVGGGESLLDAEMTAALFERLREGPKDDPLLSRLSPQEREIVHRIAEGKTNKEIATEMFLAEKTVKNYVSNLLAKLGMSRRSEAAAYVARVETEAKPPPEDWDEA